MPAPNQPQNQPKKPESTPAVAITQSTVATDPPSQTSFQPPSIAPAPYVPAVPATPKYAKSADAGMITISAEGALQFKLCYGKPGNLTTLLQHLRHEFVTTAPAIFQAALKHGFSDILLLTREGRIADAGDNTEPPADKPDLARQLFSDDKANPLGLYGKNLLHMTMNDEFATVARRRAAQEGGAEGAAVRTLERERI